jgi:hypothetical protein
MEAVGETEEDGGPLHHHSAAADTTALVLAHPAFDPADEGPLGVSPDNSLHEVRNSDPQTYGKRRRRRGTRGGGRAVGRSEVIYCSLEEELHAVVNDPSFRFNDKGVADLYKQVMNIHMRAGCVIQLANGQVKQLQPRQELGQISTLVRAMCRLDNPVLQQYRKDAVEQDGEELLDLWREHYQIVDNSVGLGLRRRFAVWLTGWRYRLLGSAQRPPRC